MEKKVKRKAGRPRDSKSLNKDDILRTALRCFAKQGYGGVTINALAKETGVLYYIITLEIKNSYGKKLLV